MRVAEFVVPKASGDREDGELIVYYFGGTGGRVEANLQRWTSQFQPASEPVRTTAKVHGLAVDESRCQRHLRRRGSPGCDRAPQQARLPHARDCGRNAEGAVPHQLHRPAGAIDGAGAAFNQFLKSLDFK